ncbi:restriction endonuclease subunit S [uncultured Parvibaculum sp.]|uniref:restriction endonuclease subunit S n=1 Tax=uncultured Parvibaculum sp. TaxID=291828 RepID=UPI0030D70C10|tara:strand:+ start:5309 stop:6544 length:1236 start_codon:yes stop_codon:yes gene_type:complete
MLVPVGEVLTSAEYGLSEPGDSSGNTPIVGMRDLVRGSVNLKGLATVDDGGNDWSAMRLRRGDILLNRTNSPDLVGKVGIVREDSEAVFASYLVRLHADQSKADPDFLNFWLNSSIAQIALKRLSTRGVSQANINPSEFRKHCPFPLAPLPEQHKIAEILRTWDEAIEKLEGLRAAKLSRQRMLTHSLVFGTRQLDRFHTSDEMIPHRWFTLPASWDNKPIGKLAREISERNADAEQHEVLSCSKYDGFVRSLEYFKKQVFSADLSGYKKIWRGDFGFPSNHVEEGSIGLQNLTDVGVVSPIYTVFRFAPEKVVADYAFAVLKTGLYRHIFEVSTSASVDRRGSLRWSEFSKLPFPVPSLAEQRAISDVLRTGQADLDALTLEIETLTRQKRGLMQKLLTGEWRVKVGGGS